MTKKKFIKFLKQFSLFSSIFMFAEAVVHLSAIRLWGAEHYWPESAIEFVLFFMLLWGAISLLLAGIFYEIRKNVLHYKALLTIIAYYSFFHGALLWYFSFLNYTKILPVPAMYAFNPYYSTQLKIEGSILIAFGTFYLWGKSKQFLEK